MDTNSGNGDVERGAAAEMIQQQHQLHHRRIKFTETDGNGTGEPNLNTSPNNNNGSTSNGNGTHHKDYQQSNGVLPKMTVNSSGATSTAFNVSAAPFISFAAAMAAENSQQQRSDHLSSNSNGNNNLDLANRLDLRGLIAQSSDQTTMPPQQLRLKLTLPSNILRNSSSINGNNGTNGTSNNNGVLRAFCNSLSGNTMGPSSSSLGTHHVTQPAQRVANLINSNNNINGHNRFDLENNRNQRLAIPANFTHYRSEVNNWGENHYPESHYRVSQANGIIMLKLKETIDIEMTLDGAIRVLNWRCNVAIALSSSSNSAAVIHPNGRVLQYQSRVEIMTYDGKNKNNFVRYAKIWYKGISFTSENCALVYLVDSGGTRTTTDSFLDLRNDISSQVFLNGSIHGVSYENQAIKEMRNHKCWPTLDGTEIHELNGFRISQTVDGMVRITKANKNILIRTSPGNGSATLTTPFIHCTASLGQTSHLFVRRGERRMHFDGAEFVVRNSGHSAGFDANNLLRVY